MISDNDVDTNRYYATSRRVLFNYNWHCFSNGTHSVK